MWKEFDIKTLNLKMEELGLEEINSGKCHIYLSEVAAFYQSVDIQGTDMLQVVLKGGTEIGVYITYDDFKKIMINANS